MKDRLLICLPQKEKAFQALPFSCFWKFTCCKFNEIQISPKEDIKVTSLFSIIIRQNTRYSNTVPRKKKLNIIIYRLFRVKKFPLFEVLFPFPGEWQGPQNKFKSKVNNNNNNKKTPQNKYFVKMLWHRLYADKEPFFFNASVGRK